MKESIVPRELLLFRCWLVCLDRAVSAPHRGQIRIYPEAKASPGLSKNLQVKFLSLSRRLCRGRGREDCISWTALLGYGVTSAAQAPSPGCSYVRCFPPSSLWVLATWCDGDFSAGTWPQVFYFAGGSGISSAAAWWESWVLQWDSCPSSLQPALSAEHPLAAQGVSVSTRARARSTLSKPTPSLTYLSVVIGQFCTEGKVCLSTLEDTGFWLESKILSFIHDQEEDYLKRHRLIYQQIIQVSILRTDLPPPWQTRCFKTVSCFQVVT